MLRFVDIFSRMSPTCVYYTSRIFVQVRIQSVHTHKPTHVHVHTKSENQNRRATIKIEERESKSKSENQTRRARIKLEERESNTKSENQNRRARIKIEERESSKSAKCTNGPLYVSRFALRVSHFNLVGSKIHYIAQFCCTLYCDVSDMTCNCIDDQAVAAHVYYNYVPCKAATFST